MNEHLHPMADQAKVQVFYESGPKNGTYEERKAPGIYIEVEDAGHPGHPAQYALSHRLPGDILAYYFLGWKQ